MSWPHQSSSQDLAQGFLPSGEQNSLDDGAFIHQLNAPKEQSWWKRARKLLAFSAISSGTGGHPPTFTWSRAWMKTVIHTGINSTPTHCAIFRLKSLWKLGYSSEPLTASGMRATCWDPWSSAWWAIDGSSTACQDVRTTHMKPYTVDGAMKEERWIVASNYGHQSKSSENPASPQSPGLIILLLRMQLQSTGFRLSEGKSVSVIKEIHGLLGLQASDSYSDSE